MKLLYIANSRIPTEKAHGIQIMKTCEALSCVGEEVTLLVPWRFNKIKEDPFAYYNVRRNFKIKKIFSLDLVSLGKIGFIVQNLTFALAASVRTLFSGVSTVYSRDELSIFVLSFFRKKLFWEAHDGRLNFVTKRVLKKSSGIVCITGGLKDFFVRNGASADKISVAPDGVDLDEFKISLDKAQCRQKLNLSSDKKIILYTGHLYEWKGVGVLAEAAKNSGKDFLFVFVGGTDKDIESFKGRYGDVENIFIAGRKPHEDIPFYLGAADILAIPNSAKSDISKYYTSPIKLFEYMASGRPIVASDIPSLREILDESSSVMCQPDNPRSLGESIKKILADKKLADSVAANAFSRVSEYSWDKRSRKIISFVGKNS